MKKHKNTTYAVLLILIFAIGIVMAFAPTASGQVGIAQPRPTAGFISVAPTLVGVGQQATVELWVLPWPEDYAESNYYGPASLRGGSFTGISVTFTKPDGTTDIFTPTDGTGTYPAGVLDGLGTMYFLYAPDEAGNWSVTMSMPAQNFTDATGTVEWEACTSPPAYFTVQTAPVNAGLLNGYPYSPLPNSNVYWTYPVSSNNREWAAITGNWLSFALGSTAMVSTSGMYQPYGSAPNTGHILWDMPYAPGGIVSGLTGSLSYGTSAGWLAYSVIIDGNLYVNSATNLNFECISLTTGKVLWTDSGNFLCAVDLPGSAAAQAYLGEGVTLAGSYGSEVFPYLFRAVAAGTVTRTGMPIYSWNFYNIEDGTLAISLTNANATKEIFVEDSGLAYGFISNSTTATYQGSYGWSGGVPPQIWGWNYSKVVNSNWATGLTWLENYTEPTDTRGLVEITNGISANGAVYFFVGSRNRNTALGFSTTNGAVLWNDTFTYTALGAQDANLPGTNDFYTIDFSTGSGTVRLYSDLTGDLLWTATNVGTPPWNTKSLGEFSSDGTNLYFCGCDGTVVALSMATGKELWQSTPIPSTELPENAVQYQQTYIIAGGNIYIYGGGQTSYEQNPIQRFSMLVCINCTTGQTVFTLNGGIYPSAEAGGVLLGVSTYSGYYYALGKGQTSTSVSAPTTAQPLGNAILLQGNVLDESPAQPGTPAVSDSSMSEWMDYLNMQNATLLNSPPMPQGVQVTLTALDPNNNTENIGTYTTNGHGNYYVNWTPPITGKYTITATFAGTGSYWPSSAQTGLLVTTAPTTTTTTTVTTSSGVSATTLYAAIAAVIVVIIVVAIVLVVLMLRKRP